MNRNIPCIPPEIETERLLLRLPKPGDGKTVNATIRASINELKPWLSFAQQIPTEEDSEIEVLEAHLAFLKKESLRYLIFDKETADFIGSTGFHDIEWDIPKLEIGYWIDSRFTGRGFMMEAAGALVRLALEDFLCRRVEIRCDAANLKSRALAEKLGFVLEGVLHNDEWAAGGKRLADTCIYAKFKE